jgi:3-oxosteroid 1-dehydrogenase
MRAQHQPATNGGSWTAAKQGDTGDAITMSQKHGAATDLMDDAWWVPMFCPPDEAPYLTVFERAKPGFVIVNGRGERFVDESAPYQHVGATMIERDRPDARTIPGWFVTDRRYLRRYPLGPIMPRGKPEKYLDNGFLLRADTIEELAGKTGVDSARLQATIRAHNGYAATGKDLEFQRGENAFDRAYADPRVRPNPCLAPIETAPFYAAQIWPGDIGTKGGLRTDAEARVLDEDSEVIRGLWAVGNSTASIMGHAYPGPGSTIGSSMVMGYVAGRNAAAPESG